MSNNVDFHIHSYYSDDGEFSPSTLVEMCANSKIDFMAISDHNTVAGIDEAMEKAKQLNIHCYPAIEIDCHYKGMNFHVLGYDINYKSVDFKMIERNIRKQCKQVSKKRLQLINELGFSLTDTDLNIITANNYWCEHWTGETFAEALLGKKEYLTNALLKPYRNDGIRGDNPYVNFYWDYCSQGKLCYVDITYPTMQEIIHIIHTNGGEAILAHPEINLNGNYDMLDELIELGLDGLEAFSSYHDIITSKRFHKKTTEKGISATRGSDFHGKTKPTIELGCCCKI
jgi:Predicted metal-dependent phosphoesterases (PHP family)